MPIMKIIGTDKILDIEDSIITFLCNRIKKEAAIYKAFSSTFQDNDISVFIINPWHCDF